LCKNRLHHTATANTDAVKWVIAAIEKFPSCVELQAPAVFFLRYAITPSRDHGKER